jgi:hypothetical protein
MEQGIRLNDHVYGDFPFTMATVFMTLILRTHIESAPNDR